MTGGWRAALPEVVLTVITVTVICAAAFAYAGGAAAVIISSAGAVLALLGLRGLAPADEIPPLPEETDRERVSTTFTGFWRRRAEVTGANRSMTGFDLELRGTLQNLLAARLAERHGISLRDDPAAARQILGDRLWYWLDPARPATDDKGASSGIPLRTLTAIIDRLERL